MSVIPGPTSVTHEITLPSNDQKIVIRPMRVEETEKFLLLQEAIENDKDMTQEQQEYETFRVVQEVVAACTITEGLDWSHVPACDLEWLFIQLRIHSDDDIATVYVKLKDCKDDCEQIEVKIPLKKVKSKRPKDHETRVQLSENMILEMCYPPPLTPKERKGLGQYQKLFKIIINSIKTLYVGDETYHFNDISMTDKMDWFRKLESTHLQKLQTFLKDIPRARISVPVKCEKCGAEDNVKVEGLLNFL